MIGVLVRLPIQLTDGIHTSPHITDGTISNHAYTHHYTHDCAELSRQECLSLDLLSNRPSHCLPDGCQDRQPHTRLLPCTWAS